MTRTQLSLLTLALCSAALGARAQEIQTPAAAAPPGPASGADALERIDRNRDGKVTKAEASADPELKRQFGALDVDNSDKLDAGEFARFEADDAPVDVPRH